MTSQDIIDMRNIVYLQSQIVAASIKATGMGAANMASIISKQPQPYSEEDFNKLIDEYGLGHNDVMTILNRT